MDPTVGSVERGVGSSCVVIDIELTDWID
jgi:hypothetical protein